MLVIHGALLVTRSSPTHSHTMKHLQQLFLTGTMGVNLYTRAAITKSTISYSQWTWTKWRWCYTSCSSMHLH